MAAVGRARQKAESPIKSPLPSALYVQASEKDIDNVKRIFRAVAYREPDRSNARRDESTSDENIFSRKVGALQPGLRAKQRLEKTRRTSMPPNPMKMEPKT